MEEEFYTKSTQQVIDSDNKIYELLNKQTQTGSIEFLILKEENYAEFVIEVGIEQNEFSDETNFGGFTIEIPINKYGYKSLEGLTFGIDELIDTHGSFYIVNTYENLKIHKVCFGEINNMILEAEIEYSLDYFNWKHSRGAIKTNLNINPIVLSNQVIDPIEENREQALKILSNYLDIREINNETNLTNLNGFRFEYSIEKST